MPQTLNLAAIKGGASVIRETFHRHTALGECGVSAHEFQILTQDEHWVRPNKTPVQNSLQALRDGFADTVGYMPFQVPAEYIAALICTFVRPVNWHVAASWFAAISVPASELAAGDSGSSESLSARQLFALIMLAAGECEQFKATHDSKVAKEQRKAEARRS